MAFDETPSLPKRKRRRVEQSKDLLDTESLRISVLESLNMLYQAQENHQRITTTIVGIMETENFLATRITSTFPYMPVMARRRLLA
jgi:hypothetical protein